MSVAQFKAGDAKGARRTLMGARAEALRTPRNDLTHTLIYVVNGMAESGFYKDAKSDIKLFPEHDRLNLYLTVARIQGEKRDFEAAKITFHEAIQLALKGNPPFDSDLSKIGVAQARMGFVDESRKTASMIRDPYFRSIVEDRLKLPPGIK